MYPHGYLCILSLLEYLAWEGTLCSPFGIGAKYQAKYSRRLGIERYPWGYKYYYIKGMMNEIFDWMLQMSPAYIPTQVLLHERSCLIRHGLST